MGEAVNTARSRISSALLGLWTLYPRSRGDLPIPISSQLSIGQGLHIKLCVVYLTVLEREDSLSQAMPLTV